MIALDRKRTVRLFATALVLVLIGVLLATIDVKQVTAHAATAVTASYTERPRAVMSITTLAYAAWIVAFLPTTVPELVMGFVFGLKVAYCIDLVGKFLGSAMCYFLGLGVLRNCCLSLLWTGPFKDLFLAFEEEVKLRPWRTAALIRSAFVPISIKNYGMALIGVPPIPFVCTLLPIELIDTYVPVAVGSTAKDLSSLLRGNHNSQEGRDALLQMGLIGAEVVVLVILIIHLGTIAKAAIERHKQHKEDGAPLSGLVHARGRILS
uniref:VTT domain-containing protein n=1 Tax=Haptolina brevifila TaxID=156173 RepID=A0A7S2FN59_9EUKA|mmetsp:Transcript_15618/g.31381  ORF Transcript_15618/g.31381 Transcript_15618/m.31381 type:complete len:265 (+) Transcript_15618:3-797(+)